MSEVRDATVATPAHGIASGSRSGAIGEMPDAMRHDVRLLGDILGSVLIESGGKELLEDVEKLRELTIAAFDDGSSDAITRAEELVESFTLERAEEVARAFTCYFHLVNLAEEYHRVRALRVRDARHPDPSRAPEDTLAGSWKFLVDQLGEEEARKRVAELEFRPVLTAHPTEARRRAVAASIREISDLLASRDDPRLGVSGLEENERELYQQIDRLWRTSPLRLSKPTPLDEIRTVTDIFDQTLFEALPKMYRAVDALLHDPDAAEPTQGPSFVRLGSWIGSDRDGNPNVTSSITRAAAAFTADHVLAALEQRAREVGSALTMDAGTTEPSQALLDLSNRQHQMMPEEADKAAASSPGEAHRRVMLVIAERLAATRRRDADLGYDVPATLLTDLHIVQDSLSRAGDNRQAYGDLQDLIWQVETFGFHLVEFEVRQHSKVHNQTLADLEAGGELSDMSNEVLETIRTMAAIQNRYGVVAAHRYVISFATSAHDIEAVYKLAEAAMGSAEDIPVLDVIPLFETFADLQSSVAALDDMLELPQVKARMEQTGRRIEIMLGYSDSSKDVGPVAATLALYEAQEQIADWAKRNNVKLTLFHGRGGALGRGGGPANRAVLAQPPGSVDGRFKLTEQGEVIAARYGNSVIAHRHMEQVAAATLLQATPAVEERNSSAAKEFAAEAATMDEASRARFFELVHADGFAPWFSKVTPQEEVGWLPLGSRPARRGLSVDSLEDLRTIPWVFAWTQARINLTGWFGLGTALATVGNLERLQEAYKKWPLFSTMIDNVEMSLAKTDERIALRYLALGDRDDLAELVMDEMKLTREWVVAITGQERLLAGHHVLGRAVQLRSPYVDALSLLQLRALRVLRTEDDTDEAKFAANRRLMLLTLNGVAAGVQNTG